MKPSRIAKARLRIVAAGSPAALIAEHSTREVAELRFAPGMFKPDSETFFSYALLFWLPDDQKIDPATMRQELLTYYRGLAKAVRKSKKQEVDVGAFTLTFIGAGAAVAASQAHDPTLIGVAIANGLAIGVMVSALGHISGGHFNPALTLGFLLTRRVKPAPGAIWFAAVSIAPPPLPRKMSLSNLAIWRASP